MLNSQTIRDHPLREAGTIRGFYADVDPSGLGLDVAAMISINIPAQARTIMLELARGLRELPETRNVSVLGGEHDPLLHVACATTGDLRDFVATHLGPTSHS